VVLVNNPRSGKGRPRQKLLERVLEVLERAGMSVEVRATERPGHATEIAVQAAEEGVDRVLTWGGDGTVNEVANGLFGKESALGVLPGGTVNVFAREVGIPLSFVAAAETFVSGEVRRIPVGVARGRSFLLMAGMGLDAEVVRRLGGRFKRTLGAAAFWIEGFHTLSKYRLPLLRIRSQRREFTGSGLIAAKTRRYGPRYFIASDARLDEPLLQVVVFRGRRRSDYLRYLSAVVRRAHLRLEDVLSFKTEALTVESDSPVFYQVDGELGGELPLELAVRDRALSVVLPRVSARMVESS
jgi:YegS/Rv2252/BmrU family lipid kinase